jgi:hypothetical protein
MVEKSIQSFTKKTCKCYGSRVTEVLRVVGSGSRTRTPTFGCCRAVRWGGVVLFTRDEQHPQDSDTRMNSATVHTCCSLDGLRGV